MCPPQSFQSWQNPPAYFLSYSNSCSLWCQRYLEHSIITALNSNPVSILATNIVNYLIIILITNQLCSSRQPRRVGPRCWSFSVSPPANIRRLASNHRMFTREYYLGVDDVARVTLAPFSRNSSVSKLNFKINQPLKVFSVLWKVRRK